MQGVLIVSFGTTYEETKRKNIDSIVHEVSKKYNNVYQAFSSTKVQKKLFEKGVEVDNIEQALKKMCNEKIKEVYILPTFLLAGIEYSKMLKITENFSSKFDFIKIAKPLLFDENDCNAVVNSVYKDLKKSEDEAIILMGHGTEHQYNLIYSALNFIATENNYYDMYITTVEGYPNFENAVNWVIKNGFSKVVLAPLMLVAGDHAVNDMASKKDDSLKSLFQEKGIQSRVLLKGLGEYKGILELYMKHLEEAV